jgi:hypothetical protein
MAAEARTDGSKEARVRKGGWMLSLALGTLALAAAFLVLARGGGERSIDERLAAAPANPELWLDKAEREDDPRALHLSLLAGAREPQLEARRRALAERLGERLDAETRALLK